MGNKPSVILRVIADGRTLKVQGRCAWALMELIRAGERGCTPIDNPGPRWSGYVFSLKRAHGLTIETRTEQHRGAFPGHQARYILRTALEVASDERKAA